MHAYEVPPSYGRQKKSAVVGYDAGMQQVKAPMHLQKSARWQADGWMRALEALSLPEWTARSQAHESSRDKCSLLLHGRTSWWQAHVWLLHEWTPWWGVLPLGSRMRWALHLGPLPLGPVWHGRVCLLHPTLRTETARLSDPVKTMGGPDDGWQTGTEGLLRHRRPAW